MIRPITTSANKATMAVTTASAASAVSEMNTIGVNRSGTQPSIHAANLRTAMGSTIMLSETHTAIAITMRSRAQSLENVAPNRYEMRFLEV